MANYQTIAPLEGITGKRKTYAKFDCYVRAKIWYELCSTP